MNNFIQPYNPDWKAEFDRIKQVLHSRLRDFDIDIQHVGSTSVPGLTAKPILDIDIIIKDKLLLAGITAGLEQAGYINRGEQGIPGRFAFRQQSVYTPNSPEQQKWMEHHLYVCYDDSLALRNHLLFRDALLRDKQLSAQYADLKMRLVGRQGKTREEYTRQKTEFIISALQNLGIPPGELREISDSNR